MVGAHLSALIGALVEIRDHGGVVPAPAAEVVELVRHAPSDGPALRAAPERTDGVGPHASPPSRAHPAPIFRFRRPTVRAQPIGGGGGNGGESKALLFGRSAGRRRKGSAGPPVRRGSSRSQRCTQIPSLSRRRLVSSFAFCLRRLNNFFSVLRRRFTAPFCWRTVSASAANGAVCAAPGVNSNGSSKTAARAPRTTRLRIISS